MKDRGLPSPDIADALACTYAAHVEKGQNMGGTYASDSGTVEAEYDPYADN